MTSTAKRLLDLSISIVGLALTSPIFILAAILIKASTKGPVFFRQARLGVNGKRFTMYKFRTMVENAEGIGTGLFNYKNDPRVTQIGRILRNTSLDELPQFFNIIKGDMALVGPRPPVSYELGDYENLNSEYKRRFIVPPGITGLAQVSGRNELSWDEKVKYDNEYIDLFDKLGIWIDLKIIFLTAVKVFSHHEVFEHKKDLNLSDEEIARLAQEEVVAKATQKTDKG